MRNSDTLQRAAWTALWMGCLSLTLIPTATADGFAMECATASVGGAVTDQGGVIVLGQPVAGIMTSADHVMRVGAVSCLFTGEPQACAAPAFVAGTQGVSIDDGVFDGYIDPRRESSNGVDFDQGLNSITVRFTTAMENDDGAPLTADRFAITDTSDSAPSILAIDTDDGVTVTVQLDGIITVQQWSTIAVDQVRSVCDQTPFADSLNVGFLPGDIDQNGTVTPFDLLRLRQYVLETDTPELGALEDFVDINRDFIVTPFDLLAFRQLIDGLPPATQSWSGVSLPDPP